MADKPVTIEETRTAAAALTDGEHHEYVEGCTTCKAQMRRFRNAATPAAVLTLIAEVDRLKAEKERGETCVACNALLLIENTEPPHCIDCFVTDEHREDWENQN